MAVLGVDRLPGDAEGVADLLPRPALRPGRGDLVGLHLLREAQQRQHRCARCIGREDEIGSLEPGKLADIAVWRLGGLDHTGIADPVAALVLGRLPQVDTLLCGGREVLTGEDVVEELDRASARLRLVEVS